ncbi:sulfite exporter TauE/SafE family protein [Vannielia litorea]|uniref:sulfite exporter TauE/SafE family protein n=1 Tax=Vannielia litorea TaxID=1217970 RepID=UPI001BCC0AC3|nr:sulfite exporter TauE/SafE family protein [Vannielia litorea]MBS8226938.1 sulfite exporter TauE/SafE family protein [Vannielia litorea]
MWPDPWVMAVAVPAVIFAGVSKGGFGSGAAFAAAPILALAIDPRVAVGLLLPLLMLIDVFTLKSFWKQWHGPSALALVLGSLPGIGLAIWLFRVADADTFRLLIGAIALLFVLYQFARARGWLHIPDRPFDPLAGGLAGAVAGFTSFISHAGGPPVAVFLLAQGMGKTMYQATSVITFWAINLLKFIPYAALGIFTRETVVLDLWLAPAAILGAWLGVKAHHMVPEKLFFALTYVLLTLTGTKLIWDALV